MVVRAILVCISILLPAGFASAATISTPNTVGTTAGEHSANSGTAGYSIPIVVPPGRAGMQPALS